MLTATSSTIAEELSETIEHNDLVLPAMPAWAAKVLVMLDDLKVQTGKIPAAVSADPAFVAQLLKTANGALYAHKPKVDCINFAVVRIGYEMLRNLVVSISIDELSIIKNSALKKHLAEFRDHSHEVAAICYVLAKSQKHLTPYQAMLAGLIHDIGRLPLLLYLDDKDLPVDDQMITTIIRKYSGSVGEQLLKRWEFPPELVEVPIPREIHGETGDTRASYADIATVANMLSRSTDSIVNWDNVTAIKRMGLATEFYRAFFNRFKNDLSAAREMLA